MIAASNNWFRRLFWVGCVFFAGVSLVSAQVPAASTKVSGSMSQKVASIEKKVVNGDVHATELLAEAYLKGDGIPKDYQMAEHLFLMAAEQNDAIAQTYLGTMHC